MPELFLPSASFHFVRVTNNPIILFALFFHPRRQIKANYTPQESVRYMIQSCVLSALLLKIHKKKQTANLGNSNLPRALSPKTSTVGMGLWRYFLSWLLFPEVLFVRPDPMCNTPHGGTTTAQKCIYARSFYEQFQRGAHLKRRKFQNLCVYSGWFWGLAPLGSVSSKVNLN